jgi:hypothetical protein
MTGRAIPYHPSAAENLKRHRTMEEVDAAPARVLPEDHHADVVPGPRSTKANYATFVPVPPPNKRAPVVTARDRASIDAAVAAGRVRRIDFEGKEIA